MAGRLVYDDVDQGVVDGIVNGSGAGAEESGQLLRQMQTGKVQQYAALLFAGAAVLAAVFVVRRLGAQGRDSMKDFLERLGAHASPSSCPWWARW